MSYTEVRGRRGEAVGVGWAGVGVRGTGSVAIQQKQMDPPKKGSPPQARNKNLNPEPILK